MVLVVLVVMDGDDGDADGDAGGCYGGGEQQSI